MKNLLSKKLGLLLPLALALTGCSSNSQNPEPSSAAVPEEMEVSESHDTGLPFDFEVEPEEFTLSFEVEQTLITAAAKGNEEPYWTMEKSAIPSAGAIPMSRYQYPCLPKRTI